VSVQAIVWAMELPIPTVERFVLVVLCEAANKYKHTAWPSVGTIMRRTGMARRTVQMALRQLEAWELIASQGRDTFGARSGTTIYTVHMGKVVDTVLSRGRTTCALGGAPHARGGRMSRLNGGAPHAPKP
jgi:hypothetical protein